MVIYCADYTDTNLQMSVIILNFLLIFKLSLPE